MKTCDNIYQAGILHDIGKIAIPDNVLLKPSVLDDLEYTIIKEHVQIGVDMLKQVPLFKDIANYIKSHHERFDGSGYPKGLKGNQIPILASILAIADAFDAMTSSRIYNQAGGQGAGGVNGSNYCHSDGPGNSLTGLSTCSYSYSASYDGVNNLHPSNFQNCTQGVTKGCVPASFSCNASFSFTGTVTFS